MTVYHKKGMNVFSLVKSGKSANSFLLSLDFTIWVMKSESTLDFDKAIVHNEMNVCLKLTHPQTIQNVDEFVSYSEQVWREIKHYINYSPDPMQ